MKAEKLTRDLRDNVAEIADRARDLSAKVKDRLDETYNDLDGEVANFFRVLREQGDELSMADFEADVVKSDG